MTKEELEKEAIKRVDAFIDTLSQDVRSTLYNRLNQEDIKDFLYGVYIDSAEPREKHIAELEEQISVLLSCKNCPDNKGGFICQKEYEDKCLTQKIQYIKELKEESADLQKSYEELYNSMRMIKDQRNILEQENAELKEKLYGSRLYTVNEKLNADILLLEKLNKEQKEHIKTLEYRCESIKDTDTMELVAFQKKLTKAKDLLNEFMRISTVIDEDFDHDYSELIGETETFLKEVSE